MGPRSGTLREDGAHDRRSAYTGREQRPQPPLRHGSGRGPGRPAGRHGRDPARRRGRRPGQPDRAAGQGHADRQHDQAAAGGGPRGAARRGQPQPAQGDPPPVDRRAGGRPGARAARRAGAAVAAVQRGLDAERGASCGSRRRSWSAGWRGCSTASRRRWWRSRWPPGCSWSRCAADGRRCRRARGSSPACPVSRPAGSAGRSGNGSIPLGARVRRGRDRCSARWSSLRSDGLALARLRPAGAEHFVPASSARRRRPRDLRCGRGGPRSARPRGPRGEVSVSCRVRGADRTTYGELRELSVARNRPQGGSHGCLGQRLERVEVVGDAVVLVRRDHLVGDLPDGAGGRCPPRAPARPRSASARRWACRRTPPPSPRRCPARSQNQASPAALVTPAAEISTSPV